MVLALSRIRAMLSPMADEMVRIADRARGLAAEHRVTQAQVAEILGISRKAVNERFSGKVPLLAWEVERLAAEFGVQITDFYRPAA